MSNELEELIGGTALPTVDDDGQVPPQPETVEPEPAPVEEHPDEDDAEEIEVAESDEPEQPKQAKPQKQPQGVPLPIHMEVKHELRDVRRELAELRSSMQQRPETPAVPVVDEPDPVDEYVKVKAEELGLSPDDVPIPARVIKQRDAWKERRESAKSQQTAAQIRGQAIENAKRLYTDDVLGEGLGFQSVVEMGFGLLTAGDKLDIELAGAECDKELYRRCVARLTASGSAAGRALAQRIQSRLAKPATTAAATGPSSPPLAKKTVPTRAEVLGRTNTDAAQQLATFGFDGGSED